MSRLGSVQQKLPCLFVTRVTEEPSAKRERQPFKVLATETISQKALDADIYNAIPTEKVDGTCCYITTYKGQPYLWARLDRKPNKQAEKRFKQFVYSAGNSEGFTWNIEEDFRVVPECWIPAKEIEQRNGKAFPDENGHIPGWVPVGKNSKPYCWHTSVVDYEFELALVLKPHTEEAGVLEITPMPLSHFSECTLELIGTNINANPYGLGSKKHPIHLLVPHGIFQIKKVPALNHIDIMAWLDGCKEGKIEGIVWHCADGSLIKRKSSKDDTEALVSTTWPLACGVLSGFSSDLHDVQSMHETTSTDCLESWAADQLSFQLTDFITQKASIAATSRSLCCLNALKPNNH